MYQILIVDCGPEVSNTISDLLGDKAAITNHSIEDKIVPEKADMIILEISEDQDKAIKQIHQLRYACNFRNIPIILIERERNQFPVKPYIMAGATELLSINDPPAACSQILQSYLIPHRKPLKEEMEYLETFIESTILVLKKMASLEAKFKDVYFSDDFKVFGDISGIISLFGKAEGTLVVTFYWELAQQIIAKMMSVDKSNINAELIHDGIAELINMISGASKKNLVGKPYYFEISLPSVVVGRGHQIGHPEDTNVAVLIFDVDEHSFAFQVCIKPKKNESPEKGKKG